MMFVYLFSAFFKIGLLGFGGGLAMLPLIFQSVQSFGLMTGEEFSNLVALSQVTPGPMAVNAATYVGFNYAGILGALTATLGVCLPAFVLMMTVFKFMQKFKDSRGVQGAMNGVRPVTVALIASAAIFVSETVLTAGIDYFNLIPLGIFAVTILLVGPLKMKPIRIMILMGIAGALLCG